METNINECLKTYCELHWWNFGKKTLSFKGELGDLLKQQHISYRKTKTSNDRVFTFHFKNPYGISYKANGMIHDFSDIAKKFIQMEMVRMGDKCTLYVDNTWRPKVTVNH